MSGVSVDKLQENLEKKCDRVAALGVVALVSGIVGAISDSKV
jgi:hypothetical protein